ncbi:MAG: hypothetical protein CVV33_04780 [Methanomicrobiales archaeon HGW-Methanomicrobiales-4]|nr:MAG: hypothetical protein CVV33_04780 [Methanomicrobiales archaeon HGW-Methanomicrobiales-4]
MTRFKTGSFFYEREKADDTFLCLMKTGQPAQSDIHIRKYTKSGDIKAMPERARMGTIYQ